MEDQKYCISARNRHTGLTQDITGDLTYEEAENWKPTSLVKRHWVYFRVSKHPFKTHKK